jgi:hypothetical protein
MRPACINSPTCVLQRPPARPPAAALLLCSSVVGCGGGPADQLANVCVRVRLHVRACVCVRLPMPALCVVCVLLV